MEHTDWKVLEIWIQIKGKVILGLPFGNHHFICLLVSFSCCHNKFGETQTEACICKYGS